MVADDKDKAILSYFLSLNLSEITGCRLGMLVGKLSWQLSIKPFLQLYLFWFLHLSHPPGIAAEDVVVCEVWNLSGQLQTDTCGVNRPSAAAKASRGIQSLSWGTKRINMFARCQWLEFNETSVLGALGGSDSLLSASGPVCTPCIYIFRANKRGRIEWVHLLKYCLFCHKLALRKTSHALYKASGNLFLRLLFLCSVLDFLRLEPVSSRFSFSVMYLSPMQHFDFCFIY